MDLQFITNLLNLHFVCIYPIVPTPDVSVAVVGDEIVGSSLSLQCNATVVKGINSSVGHHMDEWCKSFKEE